MSSSQLQIFPVLKKYLSWGGRQTKAKPGENWRFLNGKDFKSFYLIDFQVELADKQKSRIAENPGGDYADFQGQDCQDGCDIPDQNRLIKGCWVLSETKKCIQHL